MTPRRKGDSHPIGGALNRDTTKFGIDHRLLAGAVLFCIVIFLFGPKLLACLLLPAIIAGSSFFTKRDPQMFLLWFLSLSQASDYDPGKRN